MGQGPQAVGAGARAQGGVADASVRSARADGESE
jgi:hypothetical protein